MGQVGESFNKAFTQITGYTLEEVVKQRKFSKVPRQTLIKSPKYAWHRLGADYG